MDKSPVQISLLLCLPLVALGCGGSAGAPEETADTSGGESASTDGFDDELDDDWGDEAPEVEHRGGAIEMLGITPPEDKPWDDMSFDEKEWYMVGKVLPIMAEMFAEHDESRWEGMDCAHCHGEDGAEKRFAMPPRSAFRVPREGTPAWEGMKSTFGETVTFMEETVVPTMATLLGKESYSCADCHPIAE